MSDNEQFLQELKSELSQKLKPYQQALNQRQKKVDLLRQCIRAVERDDFFQLEELLGSKLAVAIGDDAELQGCEVLFARLRDDAQKKVELYRVEFIEQLKMLAAEANLPLDLDFPRFSVLKGIDGQIEFSQRLTLINKKPLKSIDPKRIVVAALKVKKQLYDGPYDAQAFIDHAFKTYADLLALKQQSMGSVIPIQEFYLAHVLSMQSKAFFQNMEKGKFKGYSVEQFAVDVWRYFSAGIGGTSEGLSVHLAPGRNKSLWLIDHDGERRQFTTIAFQSSK